MLVKSRKRLERAKAALVAWTALVEGALGKGIFFRASSSSPQRQKQRPARKNMTLSKDQVRVLKRMALQDQSFGRMLKLSITGLGLIGGPIMLRTVLLTNSPVIW